MLRNWKRGEVFMRERYERFMQGRYGLDEFGRFLWLMGVILLALSIVVLPIGLSHFFWIFGIAVWVYDDFRRFSRNISKRYAENQVFLTKTAKIRALFARQMNLLGQLKTHHIYRCPGCRQKIRVPRGKGRIEIRCPKCQTKFIKKS